MEPCVLSLAGYVLGITMMVIIVVTGAGIVLGYTYKRSVVSFLGSVREERKVHKVKPDSSVAFLLVKEVRCVGVSMCSPPALHNSKPLVSASRIEEELPQRCLPRGSLRTNVVTGYCGGGSQAAGCQLRTGIAGLGRGQQGSWMKEVGGGPQDRHQQRWQRWSQVWKGVGRSHLG